MIYDVAIVGAGPAGSTTARECAASGLSTVIVDRAEFPRDKPCGGGVNMRTARLMPFDISPVVEKTVHSVKFYSGIKHPYTLTSDDPLTYITRRSRLDAFLLEKATLAGAKLEEGFRVQSVERNGHVTISDGDRSFTARRLIAADGANGQTAKLAGIEAERDMTVALEGNMPILEGQNDDWHRTVSLSIGAVPGGYGWLFPKEDHLNIGVWGPRSEAQRLREHLATVTRSYGLEPDAITKLRGHHLPVRLKGSPMGDEQVLLAGDAAGMVDPLSGDGIYGAVRSGGIAAEHVIAGLESGQPVQYQAAMEDLMLEEYEVGQTLRNALYLAPSLFVRLVIKMPPVWPAACRLIRGDSSYSRWKQRLGPGYWLLAAMAKANRR